MQAKEWSEKHLKKFIVDQRKFLWRNDSIEMYSRWMDLKQGMTAVDVGCGLGYLGWTYWRYFGEGGKYFGLDLSSVLLEEADCNSKNWASGGTASFQQGSAYKLPYPDDFADWTMCQTLLMHLEFPEKALEEMVRITKPGGLIMCNEPDNVSSIAMTVNSSEGNISDESALQNQKLMMTWARGRKRLGHGDYSIAIEVPNMMHSCGLVEIDSRCNDAGNFVQPPYETPRQKYLLKMAEEALNEREEDKKRRRSEFKEFFLAGGGSLSSYYRHMKRLNAFNEKRKEDHKAQVENRTWHRAWGASSFFCIKGRLPENTVSAVEV